MGLKERDRGDDVGGVRRLPGFGVGRFAVTMAERGHRLQPVVDRDGNHLFGRSPLETADDLAHLPVDVPARPTFPDKRLADGGQPLGSEFGDGFAPVELADDLQRILDHLHFAAGPVIALSVPNVGRKDFQPRSGR